MYVDILASAIDEWVTDLTGPDLIEYALVCREELLAMSPPKGGSAYTALAAQIAYDRSLIALCTERGIDAHATTFSYPPSERRRIEAILRQHGVNFETARRRRARAELPPYPDTAETEGGSGPRAEDPKTPRRFTTGAVGQAAAAVFETAEVSAVELSEHDQ